MNTVQKTKARNDKELEGMTPRTRAKFKAMIQDLWSQGILVLLTFGTRTIQQQHKLYQAYLNGGPKAAKPGYSWHNFARAGDVVALRSNGSAIWDSTDPVWATIGRAGEKAGLKWGTSFGDKAHFKNSAGANLTALRKASPAYAKYLAAVQTELKPALVTAGIAPAPADPEKGLSNFTIGVGILSTLLALSYIRGKDLPERQPGFKKFAA